jgi:hypothetical protein
MTTEERFDKSTQYVIQRTEKPSSYEFGKAGNRFKLYFDTPEDLDAQIKKLQALGLYAIMEGEIGEQK